MVEDHETGCWGCGLRLLLPSYSPIFKCGWCGAITTQNERKCETKYLWWRHARDRCFVCVLLGFMLFVICMSLFHFILPFPLSVCMWIKEWKMHIITLRVNQLLQEEACLCYIELKNLEFIGMRRVISIMQPLFLRQECVCVWCKPARCKGCRR